MKRQSAAALWTKQYSTTYVPGKSELSDDQFSCGLASEGEVKLSDEQVDLLNQHPPVLAARRAFLQARGPQVEAARENYLRIFYERLQWVVANPPAPKPKPKQTTGFAKRA
jgi:hypothetical protein